MSLDMEQFSFSTHAGHQEILDFAKACEAKHVVVYHTDPNHARPPLVEALVEQGHRFMNQRTVNRTSSMDDDFSSLLFVQSSEAIEYINAQRSLESHGCKTPGKKKGKRKRKMRLSLKQSKMNTASDKYSDSLGWSTDVGRTWEMRQNPQARKPSKFNVKCAGPC